MERSHSILENINKKKSASEFMAEITTGALCQWGEKEMESKL